MSSKTAMLHHVATPQEGRLSARFQYTRLSAQELHDRLNDMGMPADAFCRIFGVRTATMAKWLRGEQDIPPWVHVATYLLVEVPTTLGTARTAAAQHIRFDNLRPELGEYPYLDDGEL